MRLTGLFALVLAVAPAVVGCGDDIKFPDPPELPDPALNGVNPPSGFTSRTLTVQISGDATEFTSAATATFGAGITVSEVTVASPSLIIATITIAGDAAPGPRDVIVTDGANTQSLLQSFEVKPVIDVFTIGTAVQGGFIQVLVRNNDTANPWIGNTVLATTGTGWNFNVSAIADAPTLINPFLLTGFVFFDVDATAGVIRVEDTLDTTLTSAAIGPLAVAARTPIALAPPVKGTGLTANATLTDPTALFSYATTGLVTADVFPTDKGSEGLPAMIFLQGGKWSDIRCLSTATFDTFGGVDPVPTVGTGFIVVMDINEFVNGTEVAPYAFDLFVDDTFFPLPGVTQANEVEPNNAPGVTATTAGALHLVKGVVDDDVDQSGTLDDDVFKVTVDGTQGISVRTTSGKTLSTDTIIRIVRENPASPGTFLNVANSGDNFVGEGIDTGVLTAGDYFIIVDVGEGFFGPFSFPGDDYELAIDLPVLVVP